MSINVTTGLNSYYIMILVHGLSEHKYIIARKKLNHVHANQYIGCELSALALESRLKPLQSCLHYACSFHGTGLKWIEVDWK